MIESPLANRTISAFPLSVGTSLAFESILEAKNPSIDPDRQIPQKIDISDYSEFWINLSTLIRNIMGSLTKEGALGVPPRELAQTLLEEVEIITSLLQVEGLNTTKAVFYACDYTPVFDRYSKTQANLRIDTTDTQKLYTATHREALKAFISHTKGDSSIQIFKPNIEPTGKPKALILTHSAYDLTSHKKFSDLHLIESHTGKLKTFSQWYSKYQNGKELVMVPFLKGLLPVFGDSEIFRPIGLNLRKDLLEIAKEKGWSPVTTKDKVLYDLKYLSNRYFEEVIKAFF